jgi:hypothetical protein
MKDIDELSGKIPTSVKSPQPNNQQDVNRAGEFYQ